MNKIFSMKKLAISTALILLIATSTFAAAISFTDAHTPAWNIPTYLYITTAPNPIGIGQQVTIVFWTNWLPPSAGGAAGDRWFYYLDITKPDNSKQTIGPLTSDPVGGSYYLFTPDALGNYSVTARFGPQVLTGSNGTGIVSSTSAYINDTFLASTGTTSFTVQEQPIPSTPILPLPTEYWARPIEGQNDNWYILASNWLGYQQALRFQSDGIAPNSAHIMWTKPLVDGGVVGGTNTGSDGMTFYDGTAYEGRFGNPLVIDGRLYYSLPKSTAVSGVFGYTGLDNGYVAVDLRTGEQIFYQNMSVPTFGQLYDYESFNQHGVIPSGYLWRVSGTNWTAYDSLNGNWLFSLYNVPSGAGSSASWGAASAYGSRGEILYYQINATAGWMALWNNTAAQALTGSTTPNDYTSTSYNQWRPVGKTVDMSKSYSWNVTITGGQLPTGTATIVRNFQDDILLGTSTSFSGITSFGTPDPWTVWAISLKPESRGQLLWSKSYPAPAGNQTLYLGPVDPVNRIFTVWSRDGLYFTGYNLDTGEKVWTSQPQDAWGFYNTGMTVAYGKLYTSGYGSIYCHDIKDGTTLWNFSVPSGLNTPYTSYPIGIQTIADGKVFLGATEHSRNAPYWKDMKVYVVNATTGKLIWSLDASTPSGALGLGQQTNGFAIADGFYSFLNLYDGQIYTIGKGPSATSISASPKVSTKGSSVLVEGSVTDIATGTTQNEQKARFPDGVPAVSDDSMSAWMQYVYEQKPKPENVTGITIQLSVIDNNGNYRDIGQTTSDSNGQYSFQWTPDIAGKYTVIATFQGSESYWPSHAETAVAVEQAAAPTQAPTSTPTSVADTYFVPAIAGLFVLIIIVLIVVVLLMLRKRP